jgi:hypothetical protein
MDEWMYMSGAVFMHEGMWVRAHKRAYVCVITTFCQNVKYNQIIESVVICRCKFINYCMFGAIVHSVRAH